MIPLERKLAELRKRLQEIFDLYGAAAVLRWDQATYMPPGGAAGRARQLATLEGLAHAKMADPELGSLLEELRPLEESLPYDSDEASLIRVTRRFYERSSRVPAEFVSELARHRAATYDAWSRARPAGDFSLVRPLLERTLELSRQLASFFPGYEHIADPLIDYVSEPGLTVATVRTLFSALRQELVPLVQEIARCPPPDDRCLHQHFRAPQQLAFALEVARQMGYDLERGRQDLTLHPFTTTFCLGDVRITTRVQENDLTEALFSTIHEAGHALYEQGIDPSFEATPLAVVLSSGLHESQSRLWENLVGRSLPFWRYFYPRLQRVFPEQLGSVPLETFYRAINRVQPSLIRTDADEVTYNLHVILRFDLELELLEGKLKVRELPEAWRERYRTDLGVVPSDDRDGVLQDSHWFDGIIGGAFQGYTIGNVLAAQFFEAAQREHPDLEDRFAHGEFGTLLDWLRERIYRHGGKFTLTEMVERVTGQPLEIGPYRTYLGTKYGELYGLIQGS
ncbi:MAG: carboxypeptidase M32 [Chloroflexia bacterium]